MAACLLALCLLLLLCCAAKGCTEEPPCVSGIYPHLAVFSRSMECGIGAVVPWAGRLWFLTYSPHAPKGSEDKLYELSRDLQRAARPESIGGTPANRMIHRESSQLMIGPYFIDRAGNVRAVPYSEMPGRPTATMRHLTDPASKVYVFDMEGALYELDLSVFHVKHLFDQHTIPGSHGKGAYTSQGRVVLANNGEWDWYREWAKDHGYAGPTGALVEWDGSEWRVVERKQFCEVTGPGGILGTPSEDSPIWATGWDKRSVILKLLDGGKWYTFRLPKASHTHDAGHGWYTEWPRIREIGDGRMLMTMHGMLWDFPPGFSAADTSGLRPFSTYLKMVVDFCDWDGRLVFACNDTSLFDNPLAGQAQSNLWFGTRDDLSQFGPPAGWGGPWVSDSVKAGEPSDPFLIAGFPRRVLHLSQTSEAPVTFTLELAGQGVGEWTAYRRATVPARGYTWLALPADLPGEWMRLSADRDCPNATAYFHFLPEDRGLDARVSASLPPIGSAPRTTGVIRPRGEDLGTLHFLAQRVEGDGSCRDLGYYEIGPEMKLRKVDDPQAAEWLRSKAALGAPDFTVDAASAVLTDAEGRRWRLPKSDPLHDTPWPEGWPRGIREVVTERSLLNCCGTIYELPRESSAGVAGLRPICTHNRMIADFCSWRGMLVIAGNLADAKPDGHYFASDDGQTGLWFGNVDDLWKLGKPRGVGGPWRDTGVEAGVPSDAYLMTGYDRKKLELTHDAGTEVTFTVEVDFVGDGTWHEYTRIAVPPGPTQVHQFADGYSAHWARLTADRDCRATARFVYE
jgi:hypothetical protein